MIEIRSIEERDFQAVAELTASVFAQNETEYEQYVTMSVLAHQSCPFMRPEHCWIAEVDGRVAAKWQGLDLELRIGEVRIPTVGIQTLVARPEDRGRGYPHQIVAEVFARDLPNRLGFDVFLGFAQRGAFYRRLGGVPVMAEYWWTQRTRRIPRPTRDLFTPLRDEDVPALMEHYRRYSETRPFSLVRPEGYWPWMIRKAEAYLMHPDGYLGYRMHDDRVEVREISGHGVEFYEDALRKLGDLARTAGVPQVAGHVPADHPLVELSTGYGAEVRIEYPTQTGAFGMASNPGRLLSKLAPELEARHARSRLADLRIGLDLQCAGTSTRLEIGPAGGVKREVSLALSPAGLLQLVSGYRSAAAILFEAGIRLDPASTEAVETLFPLGHPFIWHTDRF